MFRNRSIFTVGITLLVCLSVVLVSCGSSSTAGPSASPPATAGYKHIFYIMMENHATNEIIGNTADAPYINQLASQYGVAMSYYGVTHPSLPNYLAAISGDFQGIWDDCKADASVTCAPQEFGPDAAYTNHFNRRRAPAFMHGGERRSLLGLGLGGLLLNFSQGSSQREADGLIV